LIVLTFFTLSPKSLTLLKIIIFILGVIMFIFGWFTYPQNQMTSRGSGRL
jgi:membrane-bound ClpP family serine protease